jgi:hypothetical protein
MVHDYVRTKIEGERVVRAGNGKRGLSTCAIRPVHIYGPHDPHAIKVSITEIASGKLPFLMGDGSARFDVVYVDNVVHGHLLAAARLHDPSTRGAVGGKAYFVGEGNAINYFEFIRPYAASRGVALPKLRLPYMGVSWWPAAWSWCTACWAWTCPSTASTCTSCARTSTSPTRRPSATGVHAVGVAGGGAGAHARVDQGGALDLPPKRAQRQHA